MNKAGWSSILVGTLVLVFGLAAEAQQPTKIPRIGYLSTVSPAANVTRIEAFRQGLRELGYVEGKNIVIEWRYAEGKVDRLPSLAAELVRLKVDVIITAASPPTRAAKELTRTIPIVMAFDDDPVGSGFVASLARPGGNVTGLSSLALEIGGKQLELLKEIIPRLSRVAILGTSTVPHYANLVKEIDLVAKAVEVKVQEVDVLNVTDIEKAFGAASKADAGAVLVMGSPILNSHRTQIVVLAAKSRLPATYSRPEYVQDGGLLYYGTSFPDLFHRAATYVDKILKGAKPADLPIEQPTKFELIINMKAAKQIGLTIPPNVLARADRVIK
jgi:putative tryptophan/tyrosine transport system substrate-binding protein